VAIVRREDGMRRAAAVADGRAFREKLLSACGEGALRASIVGDKRERGKGYRWKCCRFRPTEEEEA